MTESGMLPHLQPGSYQHLHRLLEVVLDLPANSSRDTIIETIVELQRRSRQLNRVLTDASEQIEQITGIVQRLEARYREEHI